VNSGNIRDPHRDSPVLGTGAALSAAKAVVVMVHGRGASAQSIVELAGEFEVPDVTYIAPQAVGGTWYPQRFTAPIAANEPYLTSALAKLDAVVGEVERQGITAERTVLLGFSQGACLAVEYAARHARRFGGVIVYSGGLIGPEGEPLPVPSGDMAGTPVFFGCSDVDFHIPVERVYESADVMKQIGADVTTRIYPGMGHTVNADEIGFAQTLLRALTAR
jgi:predicted esterase